MVIPKHLNMVTSKMYKRIALASLLMGLSFSSYSQNATTIRTTHDAIVCTKFSDATKLENSIRYQDVASLMSLLRSGKCWEIGERSLMAFDFKRSDPVQHVMISPNAGAALLTIFVK